MRLFCACLRWAFNRLLEGISRDEIKKLAQVLFGLNSRCADDARLKAQALLDSQRELLDLEIEETEKKLGRARQKLGLAMEKLARAEKKGAVPAELEKLRLVVKGRSFRVASLERKVAELEAYRRSGAIPKVVFGGRKLWKKLQGPGRAGGVAGCPPEPALCPRGQNQGRQPEHEGILPGR